MSEKRFRSMEEVDEYLEKQLQLDEEKCCVIDVIQAKQQELLNLFNSLVDENEQLKIANARWLDKSLQDRQIRYSNANCKELTQKYLQLKEENEQLRQTMQKVYKLLEEEVDLFSEKAIEHDIIAYREMQDFDNKDAYCICTATKKAIQMLKR